MAKDILVICGPTATGKTNLAQSLCKEIDGEILSADSRQVYKGMDVGTGKDLPNDAVFNYQYPILRKYSVGFFEINGARIWGYDLVDPHDVFSVSQYSTIASKIIEDIWERKKTPIVVGGTGLYQKAIIDGLQTAMVPKDDLLREVLSSKSVDELYGQLGVLDPIRAAQLNSSDRKNPRRLTRAIEVAQWKVRGMKIPKQHHLNPDSVFYVGLTAPAEVLHKLIAKRVDERLAKGMVEEIKKLLSDGVSWDTQAMTALGYSIWKEYFEGDVSLASTVEYWKMQESGYSKRQMTWFRKDKRIKWFDITDEDWKTCMVKEVNSWHNGLNEA